MQELGKIEDMKENIYAAAREVLQHVVSKFVWTYSGGGGKIGRSHKNLMQWR